jgi:hypothetical protein
LREKEVEKDDFERIEEKKIQVLKRKGISKSENFFNQLIFCKKHSLNIFFIKYIISFVHYLN